MTFEKKGVNEWPVCVQPAVYMHKVEASIGLECKRKKCGVIFNRKWKIEVAVANCLPTKRAYCINVKDSSWPDVPTAFSIFLNKFLEVISSAKVLGLGRSF